VGEFAAIRSVLVSDRVLARIGAHYNLERYLRLGGSALNDQLGQESRLAESLEALLGALYLSTRSLSLIRPWLDPHFDLLVPEIYNDPARQNYKAALQEWTQAHYKQLPEYRVSESEMTRGRQHRFIAEVWLRGKCLGQGSGRSIKAAEQAAAQTAYETILQHFSI
jgi:ribonuclease-3